jgi:arsenite methyltransferase
VSILDLSQVFSNFSMLNAQQHMRRDKEMNTVPENDEKLREAVRERYSRTALEVLDTGQITDDSCCSSSCCGTGDGDLVTSDLYSSAELDELPITATLASLGCGNPMALAELKPGERVLDLGSGGGIDVLLSAKRVGPIGFAYGLDMTDAMLELAEFNRVEANIENVRFLKGVIENIPLPANAVDVVISNCVINLSAAKGQVLREA